MTALASEDRWMLEELLSMPLAKEEAEAACAEAVHLIKHEEHWALGTQIALYMLGHGASGGRLMSLLVDKDLDLERDKELISELLCSEHILVSNRTLNYLCDKDGPITAYTSTILTYIKEKLVVVSRFGELEKLIKCISRAFQQGREETSIRRSCLEVWDELFMRFPLEMRHFSDMLE